MDEVIVESTGHVHGATEVSEQEWPSNKVGKDFRVT